MDCQEFHNKTGSTATTHMGGGGGFIEVRRCSIKTFENQFISQQGYCNLAFLFISIKILRRNKQIIHKAQLRRINILYNRYTQPVAS